MPRYCFNWSLTGSTTIEAADLTAARKVWDAIETNTEILASADQVDFAEDGVVSESAPKVFDVEEA